MEYPVCMDDRRVGTLYVSAAGFYGDTDLRTVCRGVGKRAVSPVSAGRRRRGASGRHGGRLPAPGVLPGAAGSGGDVRCAVLRRCGGDASRPGLLARLPPEAHTVWRGGCAEVTIPWREGQPFPLEELFCFCPSGTG